MSIPIPVKTPKDQPASGRHPQTPVLPPDDPNADRIDRAPDIDPPPTEPPMDAPSEPPGTIAPPARAREWNVADDWLMVGSILPTCGPERPNVGAAF
jgi:hypothetical protein